MKLTTNYIEIQMRGAVHPFHDTQLNSTQGNYLTAMFKNSCGGSHELTLFWKVTSCCLVENFRHFVPCFRKFQPDVTGSHPRTITFVLKLVSKLNLTLSIMLQRNSKEQVMKK